MRPQILDCFTDKYNVVNPNIIEYENIYRIVELLWSLSKSRYLLVKSEDAKYLTILEEKYKVEIENFLGDINTKIIDNHFFEIKNICKGVLEGKEVLDEDFECTI